MRQSRHPHNGGNFGRWWSSQSSEAKAAYIVGVLGVLATAILAPVFAHLLDSGPQSAGGGSTPTATSTASPATSSPTVTPSPSPSASPPTPPASSTAPPATPKNSFLTQLDYSAGGPFQGGVGDNINLGLAVIAGKKYSNSFRENICINTPIVVKIPSGYTKVVGTVGYADNSFSKDGVTLQIEATAEDPQSDQAAWDRIDLISLSPTRGIPFSDKLPPGTQGIRLSSVAYACSTEIVWGNPAVES
jgi:hypothetical protein